MLEDQGKSYDVNGDMADDTSLLPSNLTSFNWHGLPVELRIIVVSFLASSSKPRILDLISFSVCDRQKHIKFHIDIDSSLVESCAFFSTFYDLLLARREDIVLDFRFFHSIPHILQSIACVVSLVSDSLPFLHSPLPFPHLSFLALSNESRDGFHSFVSLDRCLRINGKGLRRLHIHGPINVDPDDYDETMEEAEFVRHYEALDAPSLLPQLEELELINPFPFDPKMETARILSYFSLSPVNAFIWEQSRFASYGIMYYDMAMYFFDKILDQRRRGRWKTLHVVALGKNICRELVVTENPLTKLGDMIKETKIKLMGYRELQVRLLMEHNQ
ncbi:hypothetical protein BT69DRAFT_1286422 [Atractiella rhizophila]|nr:hypothetical protein BT69DRAFT_1286422 [Atractiella rhizophila]